MEKMLIIPARYDSKRLPGKLLMDLNGKSVLVRTWEKCKEAFGTVNIYVAAADEKIADHCLKHKINFIMTSKDNLTGTDRICEISEKLSADVYINIQGDYPLIDKEYISQLIEVADDKNIYTAITPITNEQDFFNKNVVKALRGLENNLIYLSRTPIPFSETTNFSSTFKHIGIYSFPKHTLNHFKKVPTKTPLEALENIEILRFIELGHSIKTIEFPNDVISIDTIEDYEKALKTFL